MYCQLLGAIVILIYYVIAIKVLIKYISNIIICTSCYML